MSDKSQTEGWIDVIKDQQLTPNVDWRARAENAEAANVALRDALSPLREYIEVLAQGDRDAKKLLDLLSAPDPGAGVRAVYLAAIAETAAEDAWCDSMEDEDSSRTERAELNIEYENARTKRRETVRALRGEEGGWDA